MVLFSRDTLNLSVSMLKEYFCLKRLILEVRLTIFSSSVDSIIAFGVLMKRLRSLRSPKRIDSKCTTISQVPVYRPDEPLIYSGGRNP